MKVDEKVLEAIGAQLEKTLQPMIEENIKSIVGKEVDRAASKMSAQLATQRQLFGRDVTGLSNEQKLEFAEKFIGLRQKAQFLEDSESGGMLVPDEVYGAIMRLSESYGLVTKFGTRIPMGAAATVTVPRDTSAELTGAYLDENSEGTESDIDMESAVLSAKQWSVFLRVDRRLLQKASVNFADYILARMAKGLASRLDLEGLAGTGAPFTGVTSDANVTAVSLDSGETAFSDVDMEDLAQLEAQVAEEALDGTVWVFHRTVWAMIKTLEDTAGNLIVGNSNGKTLDYVPGSGLKPRGTLFGYPVYTSSHLNALSASDVSTIFGIFGDLANIVWGDGGSLEIARSEHATSNSVNAFMANQVIFRGIHDHAVAIGNPDGLATIQTAAS